MSVLEIIFLYSEDICPFKSSFWSDIWQIGPDIIYWLTAPWRRELKMCWWHVRSSCPIIMWSWPDIFKIWSDNVRWPTVISSTACGVRTCTCIFVNQCLGTASSVSNIILRVHAITWSPWKALEFNFGLQGCLKSPWENGFCGKLL